MFYYLKKKKKHKKNINLTTAAKGLNIQVQRYLGAANGCQL